MSRQWFTSGVRALALAALAFILAPGDASAQRGGGGGHGGGGGGGGGGRAGGGGGGYHGGSPAFSSGGYRGAAPAYSGGGYRGALPSYAGGGYHAGGPGYPGGAGGYHPGTAGYAGGYHPGYRGGFAPGYYHRGYLPYGGAGLWFGLGFAAGYPGYYGTNYYAPAYFMPGNYAPAYYPPDYYAPGNYAPGYSAPGYNYPEPGAPGYGPPESFVPPVPWYFPTFSGGLTDYLLYNYLMAAPPPAAPRPQPPARALPQSSTLQSGGPVVVHVRVPADAQLWFENVQTRLTGTDRVFESPPIPAGGDYLYEVRATWTQDGQPITQTRKVIVHAGQDARVDFTTPAP